MVGKKLGHYEILEPLGAGGMGEVYLGEDARLGRKVAIKVLPPEFASDPERLARFEQEARAAAALNHPHIAVVHDVGSEPGDDGSTTHFMVQEYLEGQSLRERLDGGALPLGKALDLAIEVGEALIAAHKAGIIHRDLKPDNIFVTEEGHAKVLDFGLAKLTEAAAPTGSQASMSPTMLGTVAGQVMGTAGYMAPEQINGEEVDGRADLFAFGCVLYGMLTGRQAFAGKNVHDTLGRILADEPEPIAAINESLPADLGRILRRALAKDLERRYQTAADLKADLLQLQDDIAAGFALPAAAGAGAAVAGAAAETQSRAQAHRREWGIRAGLAIVALAVGIVGARWVTRPQPPPIVRFGFDLPQELPFQGNGRRMLAISPDGSLVVFVAGPTSGIGRGDLWLHRLNTGESTLIPDTTGARAPFFSPDGSDVGFWAEDQIRRVAVDGGPAQPLGEADNPYGASWAHDGTIYFGQGEAGIYRVPETGGVPEPVVTVEPDELAGNPQLLPGGEWLLFTLSARAGAESTRIMAYHLGTGDRRLVQAGATAGRYLPTGHLLYWYDDSLLAAPFDPGEMTVTFDRVSLVDGVRLAAVTGAAQFDVSESGTLVFVEGGGDLGTFVLAWMEGQAFEALPFEPREYNSPRLSPDGQKIAVGIEEGDLAQVWILEVARGGAQRLTPFDDDARRPVWSPDGDWVYYSALSGQERAIWRRRADLSDDPHLVLERQGTSFSPGSIDSDGGFLYFTQGSDPRRLDTLGRLPLADGGEPENMGWSDGPAYDPAISPDGRFLAYVSRDTGVPEIFVREIATGTRYPISNGPGATPVWARDGSALFYYATGTGLFAVEVATEPTFVAQAPQQLRGPLLFRGGFDVGLDRERLLFATVRAGLEMAMAENRINVVLNWFEEVQERVPTAAR